MADVALTVADVAMIGNAVAGDAVEDETDTHSTAPDPMVGAETQDNQESNNEFP
jgi:hypothetical protein